MEIIKKQYIHTIKSLYFKKFTFPKFNQWKD